MIGIHRTNYSGILLLTFFTGILLLLFPAKGEAQDNRLIHTNSWEYEYIKRLQQRGELLELHPSKLPYAVKDLRQSLKKLDKNSLGDRERRWVNTLLKSVEPRPENVDSMRVGGLFAPGARRSSSERLNVDDPLGDGRAVLPRARVNGYLEWENWIGQAGITFDWFYDIDPDGLDTVRRLYIRSEEAYFGYNSDLLDIYVGRFDNHWSIFDRKGAFLTDNPQSFDQIQLKFGTSKLSFSSIYGEMDSMSPDSTFIGEGYGPGGVRRYLFLHRLDWSPLPNLKLSFIEGELYFSKTAGIQLRNLLPLHFMFFESHNAPMNNDSNMMLGGSIWYQKGSFTLFLQGMIDDVDIKSQDPAGTTKSPPSFTINSSVMVADLGNNFDLGVETDIVATNAYRANQYPNQWTYAQRGLATNFSDYIRTKAYATFYPDRMEGLKVEPAMTFYWKGTEDLRELRTSFLADGTPMPALLAGTVERTIRPSLYLRYQPVGIKVFDPKHDIRFNFWVDADMGVNFTENYEHRKGASNTRFIGLFRLFGQFTF